MVYFLPYRLRRGEKPHLVIAVAPVEHLRTQKEALERQLNQAERTIQRPTRIETLHLKLSASSRLTRWARAAHAATGESRCAPPHQLRPPKWRSHRRAIRYQRGSRYHHPEKARYSFWVFDEEEQGLHCLERYDPALLTHSNTLDLPTDAANWLREKLSSEQPLGPLPVPRNPPCPASLPLPRPPSTPSTLSSWTKPSSAPSLIKPANPSRQRFFTSSKVAALLFQQGHRRLVEKQLLVSLERKPISRGRAATKH